jgi:hypothetical protein
MLYQRNQDQFAKGTIRNNGVRVVGLYDKRPKYIEVVNQNATKCSLSFDVRMTREHGTIPILSNCVTSIFCQCSAPLSSSYTAGGEATLMTSRSRGTVSKIGTDFVTKPVMYFA